MRRVDGHGEAVHERVILVEVGAEALGLHAPGQVDGLGEHAAVSVGLQRPEVNALAVVGSNPVRTPEQGLQIVDPALGAEHLADDGQGVPGLGFAALHDRHHRDGVVGQGVDRHGHGNAPDSLLLSLDKLMWRRLKFVDGCLNDDFRFWLDFDFILSLLLN